MGGGGREREEGKEEDKGTLLPCNCFHCEMRFRKGEGSSDSGMRLAIPGLVARWLDPDLIPAGCD